MRPALAALGAALCSVGPLTAADTLQLVTRDVYLMGTRAQLAAYAPDRRAGLAILDEALATLERTEAQLSTWRDDSTISRLNRAPIGEPWHADADLCAMMDELRAWHGATEGAFDPAIGALLATWRIHAGASVPDEQQVTDARRRSGLTLFDLDRDACTIVRRAEATLDTGAFGKGEALDRVARALGRTPWMIDLGGQVSVGGAPPPEGAWLVDLAHPRDRDRASARVELRSGSLSTSGGSERDVQAGTVRIGHILDPRSGHPATFRGSVVVWHQRGLLADILSTALYVMGPDDGLRWAESRGIAAAYLLPEGDAVRTSATSAWSRAGLNARPHGDAPARVIPAN